MDTVLLTGFAPFGDDTENPSQQVAEALDGRRHGSATTVASVLPVEHGRAADLLIDAIDRLRPSLVLATGLASGRCGISLERVALNAAHYPLPDSNGCRLQHTDLAVDGALAYRSTLPLDRCYERLQAAGIPVELSYSAGTYLCNEVFYAALRHASAHDLPYRAGFIHMPYASAYIARRGHLAPSLPVAMLVEALGLIVQECMQ